MKRIKVLGLCLVAAFALSVAAAASVQAAKSIKGPVQIKSKGAVAAPEAELGNSVANIRCKAHAAHSEIVGGTLTQNIVSHYTGCKVVGQAIPCENVGPEAIETDKLVSDIDWINKAKAEVGADFRPESGELLAKFNCKGLAEVKVYGALIGLVKAVLNSPQTTGEVKFTQTSFKNQPENFEGEGNEHLEAEFTPPGSGKVASGQIQADETENEPICTTGKKPKCGPNPAELNTIANPAQPEYGRCKKQKAGAQFSDANCTVKVSGKTKGKYAFVPIPG